MKKGFTLFILFLFSASVSKATIHLINFSYPNYEPNSMSVFVGDTILWKGDFTRFPLFAGTIPEAAPIFSATEADSFKYVVTTPGTYKYQCPPYRSFGMSGYFIALTRSEITKEETDSSTVYISFIGNSFHLVTPDALPHSGYKVTINGKGGLCIYTGEIKPEEKDKWIATAEFPTGNYMLTITNGQHIFGRRFSK